MLPIETPSQPELWILKKFLWGWRDTQELKVFVALPCGAQTRFDNNSSSRGSTTHFTTPSTNMNIYEVGAIGMCMTVEPAYIKVITSEAGKEP